MRFNTNYDQSQVLDIAPPTEYLTPQNSELYRRSLQPRFEVVGGGNSLQPLQNQVRTPTPFVSPGVGGGSAQVGYSDRTDAASVLASTLAAKLSASQPQTKEFSVDDYRAMALQNHPLLSTLTPDKLLEAQLTRDPQGYSRQVLAAMSPSREDGTVMLKPHTPPQGFGGTASEETMNSSLDMDVVNHPKFQEIAARDPAAAKHVYLSITGRDLAADMKVHQAISNKRDSFKTGVVQDLIKRGAYQDPGSGALMVWRQPGTSLEDQLPGSSGRSSQQFVEASPDETAIWNEVYPRVTGHAGAYNPVNANKRTGFIANNAVMKDPAVQAAIHDWQTKASAKVGHPVTANSAEMAQIARDAIAAQGNMSPGMAMTGRLAENINQVNPLSPSNYGKAADDLSEIWASLESSKVPLRPSYDWSQRNTPTPAPYRAHTNIPF